MLAYLVSRLQRLEDQFTILIIKWKTTHMVRSRCPASGWCGVMLGHSSRIDITTTAISLGQERFYHLAGDRSLGYLEYTGIPRLQLASYPGRLCRQD